jgi:hypothetical protein
MLSISMRRLLLGGGLLSLLPLVAACHDDVIPEAPPPTEPGPAPMASFTADPVGTEQGVRLKLVEITGRNTLQFALETTWPMDRPPWSLLAAPDRSRRPGTYRPGARWGYLRNALGGAVRLGLSG